MPGKVISAQERARAWAMRKAGTSPRRIAQELGVDPVEVRKALAVEMREATADAGTVDSLRAMEAERLDDITATWWAVLREQSRAFAEASKAEPADPKLASLYDPKVLKEATAQLLRVSAQRAKLLGLEMPTRHEVDMRVFDQFAELVIQGVIDHVPQECQAKIRDDIAAALATAERHRTEEPQTWIQALPSEG